MFSASCSFILFDVGIWIFLTGEQTLELWWLLRYEKNRAEHFEDEAFIRVIKSDVCVCLLSCVCKCAREQIEVSESIWLPNTNCCNTSSEQQNTNCTGSFRLSPWARHWRSWLIMVDGEQLKSNCTGVGCERRCEMWLLEFQ